MAVENIGVAGIPVEVVSFGKRFEAVRKLKQDYPGLIVVDYTLPQAVNGELWMGWAIRMVGLGCIPILQCP